MMFGNQIGKDRQLAKRTVWLKEAGSVLPVMVGAMCLLIAAASVAAQSSRPWIQETAAAPWAARVQHTSVVFNNRMWVIGGGNGNNTLLYPTDVWSSADGVNWTQETAPALWLRRTGHATVVFNNRMWVLGGNGVGGYLNDVWSSADGINWTQETAAAPWLGRDTHTAVVFNNRMWVMGGFTNLPARSLNDIWSSPDGVNWTPETLAAQWSPRRWHTTVVFNSRMWVAGGRGGGSYYTGSSFNNEVWSSADGISWTLAAQTPAAQWWPRYSHTSVVFDNRMWVMGGYFDILGHLNDVWSSADGINWTQEAAAAQWLARVAHTTVAFNNRMWVMGGSTSLAYSSATFYNDVWSWTDHLPLITSTAPTKAIAGQPFTYTVTATGNPAPSIAVGALPSWLSFDNIDTLSGTPTEADIGPAGTIVVAATNSVGVDDQMFQLEVEGAPPVITTPALPAAATGVPYSFTVTATGIPAPTFSAAALPLWLSLNTSTGELSGTPSDTDIGLSQQFSISVDNAWAPADTENFDIQVNGLSPLITSTPTATATVGSPYTYVISGTGNPPPAFSVSGLPGWLTFDNVDTIGGTPPGSAIGMSGPITVTATNGWTPDDTQAFQIDVGGVAPVFTSTPIMEATPKSLYTYTATATGTPAPTLSVTSALPAWLNFDPVTGALSGTPGNSDAKTTVQVTIQATNTVAPDAMQTFTIQVARSPDAKKSDSDNKGCVSSDSGSLAPTIALILLALLALGLRSFSGLDQRH
jgi:hypothetical protein